MYNGIETGIGGGTAYMNTHPERNGYILKGRRKQKGYEWWWHSLLAENAQTGEVEPFFIEYYVINPGIAVDEPVFGQLSGADRKPSYAMIKAGKWGKDKAQIHNFWGTNEFFGDRTRMDIRIGPNCANEKSLKGSVCLSEMEAKGHPEYMSDPGEMSWDLKAEKYLSYSVGYGASKIFRMLNIFQMYWHVQGLKVRYSGTIIYNGQEYRVRKETSCGYQDKNWGIEYTDPWIWLNCNRFFDANGMRLDHTSLDIGGGNPRVLGVSVGEKLLAVFHHNGERFNFNFSRLFYQKQQWQCSEDDEKIHWQIEVANRTHILQVSFSCPKASMLLVNYENPFGIKNHHKLWNGGYASGTVTLYRKCSRSNERIGFFVGTYGGCEYGRCS